VWVSLIGLTENLLKRGRSTCLTRSTWLTCPTTPAHEALSGV